MNYKEKVLLVSKSKKEIETIREEFIRIMKIGCGIRKSLDNYLLFVNSKADYRLGLIYANHLAKPRYIKNTKYVDVQGNLVELDKFCICQVKVLKGEEEELLEKLNKELSKELGLNVSMQKLSEPSHCYNFSACFCQLFSDLKEGYGKYAMSFQESMYKHIFLGSAVYLNKLKYVIDKFIKNNMLDEDRNEVFSLKCFDIYGDEFLTDEQKKKINEKNLLSYVHESSLYLGVKHPEGLNLAPKYEEKEEDYLKDYRSRISYSSECSEVASIECIKDGIRGIFECSTHLEEEYGHHPSKVKQPIFKMDDKLKISCEIIILDEAKLKVVSHVTGQRTVEEQRLSQVPSVYETLYQNSDYTDGTFTFTVTDYYEIIDLQLLLHYTDSSKYYETYKIPIGFRFESGLTDVLKSSNVFDDGTEGWICYDDISEVKKALLK